MKSTIYKVTIFTVTLGLALTYFTSPILAAPNTMVSVVKEEKLTTLRTRGDNEISRRITSLNTAISNIQAATKLTDTQKSALISSYQTTITNLNTLKSKIDADTDLPTLKADVVSVFNKNRVYMLVMPQTNILRAADRVQDAIGNFNTIVNKLQTRINDAKSAGKNVTSMQSSLTGLQSKLSDASTQAQNAVNLVTPLEPDAGNQTVIAINKQALTSARADIKIALQDLQSAKTDTKSIISALKAVK